MPLWRRCPAYQLLVGAHTLKLGTAPRTVEPFFCTLAVWDTRHARARVTEDFHFDLNRPADALALSAYEPLRAARAAADAVTRTPRALFSFADGWRDGYTLVLRVYRVLYGDAQEADELYLRERQPPSEREMDKHAEKCAEKAGRLWQHRQSFAVAAWALPPPPLAHVSAASAASGGESALSASSSSSAAAALNGDVYMPLFSLPQPPSESAFVDLIAAIASSGGGAKKLPLLPSASLRVHVQVRHSVGDGC